jgi:heme ABC exporter ATP-binding subunit CcmA
MTADPLVRVIGLRKVFGTVVVLDSVSLEIGSGEAVALLGPNGAGKTTLLRILATLARPTRGLAFVAGFDCAREPEPVRERVGLIGHGTLAYEDLTALENLHFWSVLGGIPRPRSELLDALGAVELDDVADERLRSFSAGMKRRLALARVLLARPPVLLLDEPFTGLDQRGRKWLEEYLQAEKARGGAILMVTHSLDRGLGGADRVAILAGGRIALDVPRARLTPDELARLYALATEEGA